MTTHANNRILVIDDNRAIHDDFRKMLCPDGKSVQQVEAEFFGEATARPPQPVFEIDSAFQGEEGVAALRRAVDEGRPYAMAFVDVRMPPGIDGVETAERLWQICPELQVVICTAHSDYSWQEMIGRLGNLDRLLVLKKPFASVEALQLACALCKKWELTQAARDRLAETERIVGERTGELRETNARLQAEMERRKKVEAHLVRVQRLESIGTLAGGIAHDLNNMLTPILMSAELLRAKLPEDFRDIISVIEESADRAATMVKQVLTFAHGIEGERLPLQPRQMVRHMEKIIAKTFPPRIHLDSRIPVLLNLCVNARDAMPDGGTLRIEVDDFEADEHYVSLMPEARVGRYVRLRVSDTGIGIAPHLIDKIFDPFFTTKRLGKGTGLGLSTVMGIVRSHQGFVNVLSEVGKGSVFEVFLPAFNEGALSVASQKEAADAARHDELTLVVDDERPFGMSPNRCSSKTAVAS